MPAFDQCHEQVVRALQKDGWSVIKAPLRLQYKSRSAYVDVEMSRGTNGNRELMAVVEIKCFPEEKSPTPDLYEAIGQYLVYRAMIVERAMPHIVYLAVPEHRYNTLFDIPVMRVIRESQIKIVIISLEAESVVQWIETP